MASTIFFTSFASSAELTPEQLAVCKAVFTDGHRDISSYSSDVERARDYFNGVCSINANTYSEFQKRRQKVDSSGDTPWGLYDFKWKDDKDGGKFKDELSAFCTRTKDEQFLREKVSTSSSTINQYLGGAFNQCVTSLASFARDSNLDIFQTFSFQGSGGKHFSVYVAFSPLNKNDDLEISSISPESVICRYGGNQLAPKFTLKSIRAKADFPINCERPSNEKITFTLAANGMSTNKIAIPEWNDPVPSLRSDINALASGLTELKKRVDEFRVTLGDENTREYSSDTNKFPGSTAFWTSNPVEPVNSSCPGGSVLTGIDFDMWGKPGTNVRSPSRVKFTCRRLQP